jgi:hypothetical protein
VNDGFAKIGMTVAATIDDSRGAVQFKFVGTWMLAALEGEGVLVERLGVNPVGILIYDPHKNMSVQIMNREHGRAPLTTDNDIKAAFQSYVGYFGNYSIDPEEKSITHHVVGSLYPRDVGRSFKRLYEFYGDQLILTATGLIGGDPIAAQLVWTRTAR